MTKEEAIERVRTRFDRWALDEEDLAALQALGLATKESEDERIRKELLKEIEFISPRDGETDGEGLILPSYHARIDRYKSYLEKQKDEVQRQFNLGMQAGREEAMYEMEKEQKPAECIEFDNKFKNQVSHLLASVLNKEWEYNKDFVEYTSQQLLEYAKHEIKPAEWSEEDKDYYDTIVRKLEVIGDDSGLSSNQIKFLREHCPSPRSEWSEEDEKMLTEIINNVNGFDAFTGIILQDSEQHEEKVNWLKSFPERFNLQPKQEWSEEDKRNLYNTIEAIKYAYDVSEGSGGWLLINWLKYRLRYQSHWKPSEKQMEALEDAFRKDGGNEYRKVINSLYRDLEKLL